ncbi:metalloregulator ArsR/SmtB family transcription factor [Amycolatopsis sp. Poz14]|uniref:helix-turn-helix transcriptional regulator n=1 Tax=Amycolatopsis sp. Poz14 TaxID=1447705 RepID=UPI001EE8C174|nr:helix-turn-helix domain-containing protein [Amycolatopsis sp. Poz14]MCG3753534.1 helix-turn-helix domain-containing protein [Amycolatopsis sp. Poz14]
MSEQTLTDPPASRALGESRARVLAALRSADAPVAVQDVAEQVGLHANTARFHLDGLVESGLAERRTEDRTRPGRPRTVYAAIAEEAAEGRRSYRLLAEMLTGLIAENVADPGKAAESAGEAWGRYLADRPPPTHRVDEAEGIRRLSTVLSDAGFAPDPSGSPEQPVIRLRHCPFREIAEERRDVVCGLHLGLMRGVLEEVRAPLTAERLEAFVEPSLCLAHLKPAGKRRR